MSNFIYKHGVLSVLVALWAMGLVGYATYMMFSDISLITAAANAAYASLLGLPPAAIALYKWRNSNVGNSTKPRSKDSGDS